jgi:hypothetical protein
MKRPDVLLENAENSQRRRMKHVTNRTWMPDDERRLIEMSKRGVSAVRAAVSLKRSIVSVKAKAKQLGAPFPDDRVLKRERRLHEANTSKSL